MEEERDIVEEVERASSRNKFILMDGPGVQAGTQELQSSFGAALKYREVREMCCKRTSIPRREGLRWK